VRGVVAGSACYAVFTPALWIAIILVAGTSAVAAQPPTPMPTAAGSRQSIDDIRENYRFKTGPLYGSTATTTSAASV